jgi:hypothetical protein
MSSRLFARARLVLPPVFTIVPLLLFFLVLEGPLLYLEWRAGRRANLEVRPGSALLLFAAMNYGFFRVLAFHPAFRNGYRTWLESTPWTYRKPLPLGPVELVWEDGLFLALLILVSAVQPEPRSMHLLCTFLATHLLALTCSFWLTRSWAAGYVTAFALGLAVSFWRQPLVCVALLSGVYLIAYEGLRQAMASFPWKPRRLPKLSDDMSIPVLNREPCGWPHDRMMGQVVDLQGTSRIDAVLGCLLASWWLSVLVSLIRDPGERRFCSEGAFVGTMFFAPFVRLMIYAAGYSSPISFWGRICTSRWIIPGYDRVHVAPLCALIAGPATLVFLQACSAPEPIRYSIATGMVVLVAILTPPRLRQWRLTGQHRIVNTLPAQNTKNSFVKVG